MCTYFSFLHQSVVLESLNINLQLQLTAVGFAEVWSLCQQKQKHSVKKSLIYCNYPLGVHPLPLFQSCPLLYPVGHHPSVESPEKRPAFGHFQLLLPIVLFLVDSIPSFLLLISYPRHPSTSIELGVSPKVL